MGAEGAMLGILCQADAAGLPARQCHDKSGKKPAYNAKVSIYHGEEMQYAELHPVKGYQSSVEDIIHFGLKDITSIDSIKVEWLNGKKTLKTDLKANKMHTIPKCFCFWLAS